MHNQFGNILLSVKIPVKRMLIKFWIFQKYLELHHISIILDQIGWMKSLKKGLPLDKNGDPLPWFTYPANSFLKSRLKTDMKVFEYGSGFSTLWWSKNVGNVVACEHDQNWFLKMKELMPENVQYYYKELVYNGEYSKLITNYHRYFDIVCIDGRDRVNCVRNSIDALKEDGVIVWDNSDREKYLDGFMFLYEKGFRQIEFEGIGPISAKIWKTSIFYRSRNCFNI